MSLCSFLKVEAISTWYNQQWIKVRETRMGPETRGRDGKDTCHYHTKWFTCKFFASQLKDKGFANLEFRGHMYTPDKNIIPLYWSWDYQEAILGS
jgi:hypothetical protein